MSWRLLPLLALAFGLTSTKSNSQDISAIANLRAGIIRQIQSTNSKITSQSLAVQQAIRISNLKCIYIDGVSEFAIALSSLEDALIKSANLAAEPIDIYRNEFIAAVKSQAISIIEARLRIADAGRSRCPGFAKAQYDRVISFYHGAEYASYRRRADSAINSLRLTRE